MATKKSNEKYEDPELDDLLNDALEDFNKHDTAVKTEKEVTEAVNDNASELWNEEFMQEQAKAFQESMAKLFGEGGDPAAADTVALGFQKMAEAASMALKNDHEGLSKMDPEFSQSIQEVLKGLNEGQEAAQNPFNAEELANMFQGLDMGGENGEAAGFVPFMQSMMQSLLSAEILLPSLKDLVEKYPKYLADNATKLSAEDKEKYEKQFGLIKEVVEELEKEKATDTPEAKKERFNVVLEKMQKMQDLGQPPAELLGDGGGASLPGFDPALNDQCCVM